MAEKEEVPFKFKAYRTIKEGDQRYTNWRESSMVTFDLVAEIDGIDVPIATQVFRYVAWERMSKKD